MQRTYQAEVVVLHCAHIVNDLSKRLHLAKSEKDLSANDAELFRLVAESQFNVVRYIAKNRNAAIILENRLGIDQSDKKFNENAQYIKSHFPNGLPSSYSQLNYSQKKCFYMFNVHFALYNGLIDKTYDDDITYNDNREKILGEWEKSDQLPVKLEAKISQQREYLSLAQAQLIAETTKKKVVLIMGGLHSFTDVAACFPSLTLSIENLIPSSRIVGPIFDNKRQQLQLHRPEVDCPTLSLGFFGKRTSEPKTQKTSAANNYFSYATALLGILAIGLLVYSFYSCCRCKNQKKRKEFSPRIKR